MKNQDVHLHKVPNMKLEDLMEKGSHLNDMKTAARAEAKKFVKTDRKTKSKNPHPVDSYHGKIWAKEYEKELARHPVTEGRQDDTPVGGIAERNFTGEKIHDEMDWVGRMKDIGANGFAVEREEGFPDMLIYAVKDKVRLLGTWDSKEHFGKVFSSKDGKQPGLRFEVGYRASKRNLEWIDM